MITPVRSLTTRLGRWLGACGLASLLMVQSPGEVPEKAASGAADKATTSPTETTAKKKRGVVWKVTSGKVPVYLVGSFHILRAKDLPLPRTFDTAYEDAKELVFEIAPGEMEASAADMMGKAMLPADKSLDDLISPETKKLLETNKTAEAIGPMAQRMRPWMIALLIAIQEYQALGADPNKGVEKLLETRAEKDKKATSGLETADFQLSLFSSLSDKEQDDMLQQTLKDLKRQRAIIKELFSSWSTGDEAKLDELMSEGFETYPHLKAKLLTDRNKNWIPKIEAMANGDKSTMVVVGVGHLCGKESVVELLKAKGWKLERVELK